MREPRGAHAVLLAQQEPLLREERAVLSTAGISVASISASAGSHIGTATIDAPLCRRSIVFQLPVTGTGPSVDVDARLVPSAPCPS